MKTAPSLVSSLGETQTLALILITDIEDEDVSSEVPELPESSS